MSDSVGSTSIPIIDIDDFHVESGKLIIGACEEWGCFRIAKFHDFLPESLILEMKQVVKSLFQLPTEIKMRNKAVIAGSGYMAPSEVNPLYEALGLYDVASPEAVDSFCTQLGATPHQRTTIVNYAEAVNGLTMEIANRILQGLGIGHFSFKDWVSQFRINKYSFTPESVGSLGVQLHTDSSFLTILQDDENIGGLEVMRRSGEFQAVDPCPGTLIVNLGDIAAVWSNGRFLNVKHRVMCKQSGLRFSVASFLLGPKEALVEAPSELVLRENRCRLFRPFLYQEYRSLRVSNKLHAGEILDL
ncbi:hypothetical protein M569_07624, partial [Genlisea aurea]